MGLELAERRKAAGESGGIGKRSVVRLTPRANNGVVRASRR
jgi:hypothetical protein